MDTASPPRRLSPFALPAETDARFLLLLISGLLLATMLGLAIAHYVWPEQSAAVPAEPTPNQAWGAAAQLFAPPAMVLLVAGILYWTYPNRLRKQKQAMPLVGGSDTALENELHDLALQSGVSTPPGLELGPGLQGGSGQAYGRPGKYTLYLDGGMRLQLRKARDSFRAVVLHELAHIHNKDVWRAYAAQAIWQAAIWIILVPFLVASIYLVLWGEIGRPLFGLSVLDRARLWSKASIVLLYIPQVLACIALVYVIRAGLLRVRELYADARAASAGAAPGLRNILQQQQGTEVGRIPWLRLHPRPQERLRLLDNTSGLFDIRPDLPFLVGVLVAWLLAGSEFILSTAMPLALGLGTGFGVLLALAMVVAVFYAIAYLLAATLGLQVQRRTLVDMLDGRLGLKPYLRLLLPSLLMAAGLAVGFAILPAGDIVADKSLPIPAVALLLLLLAALFNWLGLAYARFSAVKLLGAHTGKRPPRGKLRLLNLELGVIFATLYFCFDIWHFCGVFPETASNEICAADTGWLIPTLRVALGVWAALFLATFLVISLKRWIWPPRCPHCGARLKSGLLLGRKDAACGGELSEWLFAPDVPTAVAQAAGSKAAAAARTSGP